DITSASPDANINPRVGEYSLAAGSIELFLNGVPVIVLQSGPFSSVSALVEDSVEAGPDVVTYSASSVLAATNEQVQGAAQTFNVGGFIRLTGLENFLVNGDALPTGPSGFNWNQFVDGYGEFGDAVAPVFEGGAPANGFTFVVDTAVPEPGTLFGVAAGGLVLFLKRRQSR
ncbi:MAG: PEP-CTERM sorting domain-containing protein, partial [Acidobacteria bacterium]|nr:PEP-CTERM sorting domain-containing protein [Acidobacteriota bacterium]